ncbi:MAG: DUF4861 family protein [Balneolaceae bacterium]|nr:DUF4861 family protein [Balneolaceae bacterium]MBO6547307.1 DUF4861 family protein [Balneolaceae bacterium]MBO6647746.1 DUF4861 family protein [Balneolaceae bacterium]
MKRYSILPLILLPLLFISCSKEPTLSEITLTNNNPVSLTKKGIEIDTEKLSFDVDNINFEIILKGLTESIPYQLDDLNKDGKSESLFFQIDFDANESKTIVISEVENKPEFEKLTDAVLKVRETPDPESMQVGDDFEEVDFYSIPADLKQDNGLVFLEGPAWESNLVGYRYYIDDRTRFDIFGKTTNELVLNHVSGDYHEIGDWGADILSVGSSLGMGSPAVLTDTGLRTIDNVEEKFIEIVTDGPLRSIMKTTYMGWSLPDKSVDLIMNLEILAHHRYTKLSIETTSEELLKNLTTGLVKHPTPPGVNTKETEQALTVYSWGNHSYFDDLLGKAILVNNSFNPVYDSSNEATDLIHMTNADGAFEYYLLAAWGLEPQNSIINDEQKFESLLTSEENQLFNEIDISIVSN